MTTTTICPLLAAGPRDYILPLHDDWGPQTPTYVKFKAAKPVLSHLPSQVEVIAKPVLSHLPSQVEVIARHGTGQDRSLGRLKVIQKAFEFQDDTSYMQNLKHPAMKR